jgi:hypothetical protein
MIFNEKEVKIILHKLDIEIERERGDEILALCPGHELRTGKRDENPSWSVNTETGVHHCFSCGYKGNLITLVAEQLELFTDWNRLDLDKAKSWLRTNTDVDLDFISKQLADIKESYIAIPRPVEMSEARLAIYSDPPTWALVKRGLTIEATKKYGIKWEESGSNWITPIRSRDGGKLLGWQEKGETNRHFKNRPTGVTKSKTLFGMDCWDGKTMIVVESPLDAVKLESIGFSGGVACYGASVSSDQILIMREAEHLIFAFDNPAIDTAGKAASLKMLSTSRREGIECWFFNYGNSSAKDIGDMTVNEITFGIENAKHCVIGKHAIGV